MQNRSHKYNLFLSDCLITIKKQKEYSMVHSEAEWCQDSDMEGSGMLHPCTQEEPTNNRYSILHLQDNLYNCRLDVGS